jgi:soluble lytic murein transglycosylase-like protein
MNLSVGGMAPKLKMILVLAAAIAALSMTFASVAGPASAYSGGTSTTSDGSGGKYKRLWRKTSRRNKRWANRTAECESGKDPDAIGGGGAYRGAFQFMKSTWRHAPKSPGGDPIKYRYRTQAVVAVYLKKRDGTGHWPNCG